MLDLLRLEKAAPLAPMAGPDRAEALAKINRFAPKPVEADAIDLWTAVMANDQIDRTAEQFPLSYLERFATTLPGAPVLLEHDKRRVPVGRFYDARVEKDSTGSWQTVADFYVAAESEASRLLALGIAKEMSLGFMSAGRTCDLDGKKIDKSGRCEGGHQIGSTYDGRWMTASHAGDTRHVTAFEGSLVGVGAQYGAGVIAAKSEENDVEKHELEERVKALETDLSKEKAAVLEATTKAAELEAKAKDGDAYRAYLTGEYVRMTNAVAKDDEAAKPMLPILERSTAEQLQAMVKMAQGPFDRMYPPTPASLALDAGAVPAPEGGGTVPRVVPDNPYFARRA
jgi:hypothetical protein